MLPYLVFGYAGHDLELHVTSWMEVAESWRAGVLYPGWSPRANLLLGDPHFCFYPPLSFIIGGALACLLPIHLVPAAFMWFALTLAGSAMYWAAEPLVAQQSRLPAALVYTLSPYLITTSLVRFAAAELLVQSLLPLILLAFWRGVWLKQRLWVALLGVLLGLAWLTNIPAAIVLFYGLLPAVIYRVWQQQSSAPALKFALSELLAVALAAFHLVPVLLEKGWISQDRLVRQDPRVLLMFFQPDAPSLHPMRTFAFGLWLMALVVSALAAACLVRRNVALRLDPLTQMLLIIAGTALLFQTPLAAPLWTYLPQLGSAAFPYRFLPLECAPAVLVLFGVATSRQRRAPGYTVFALLTLVAFAEFAIVQTKPDTRMPSFAATLTRWNTYGYEGFPEFVPAGITLIPAPSTLRPEGDCVVGASEPLAVKPSVQTASATGCTVRFARLAYPYWRATLDGTARIPLTRSADGRVAAFVPAGRHRLELAFTARSPERTTSLFVSVCALLGVAIFCWRQLRSSIA